MTAMRPIWVKTKSIVSISFVYFSKSTISSALKKAPINTRMSPTNEILPIPALPSNMNPMPMTARTTPSILNAVIRVLSMTLPTNGVNITYMVAMNAPSDESVYFKPQLTNKIKA